MDKERLSPGRHSPGRADEKGPPGTNRRALMQETDDGYSVNFVTFSAAGPF